MDSYAGSLSAPVTLYKYLYANANPVMNSNPSGFISISELATRMGIDISQKSSDAIRNAIIVRTLKRALAGAVAGAVFGGVDSYLSGDSMTEIFWHTVSGFYLGAYAGIALSFLMVYAQVYVPLYVTLHIFKYGMLLLGGYGVRVALDENNGKLALFRAISTLVTYAGFSKALSGIKCEPIAKGGSKYVKASFWERIRTKTAKVGDINPNPLDEFSNPKIGPNESAVSRYIKEINTNGTISEPIEVQKLSSGGYEIVNGHHRWLAAIKTGLKDVPIKIVNYEN
ncbi:MAG: ParB N-terminal domain-containing protein [Butyrivibrio sp.]|nr:ParB N-terminal domain-containing protein [Butyrivibrio sp.]